MSEGIPLAAPIIGQGEIDAVERVLRSGMLAQGPEVLQVAEAVLAFARK